MEGEIVFFFNLVQFIECFLFPIFYVFYHFFRSKGYSSVTEAIAADHKKKS